MLLKKFYLVNNHMTDCKSPRDANQKASEGTNWSSALVLSEKNQISSEEQKKKKNTFKIPKVECVVWKKTRSTQYNNINTTPMTQSRCLNLSYHSRHIISAHPMCYRCQVSLTSTTLSHTLTQHVLGWFYMLANCSAHWHAHRLLPISSFKLIFCCN